MRFHDANLIQSPLSTVYTCDATRSYGLVRGRPFLGPAALLPCQARAGDASAMPGKRSRCASTRTCLHDNIFLLQKASSPDRRTTLLNLVTLPALPAARRHPHPAGSSVCRPLAPGSRQQPRRLCSGTSGSCNSGSTTTQGCGGSSCGSCQAGTCPGQPPCAGRCRRAVSAGGGRFAGGRRRHDAGGRHPGRGVHQRAHEEVRPGWSSRVHECRCPASVGVRVVCMDSCTQ